ncbi:hypothetical protein AGMMS49975_04470 [Clostridia bacterium]|nr:hypothetical protein AGMMS49975_04470 [Clostridia bacterium]
MDLKKKTAEDKRKDKLKRKRKSVNQRVSVWAFFAITISMFAVSGFSFYIYYNTSISSHEKRGLDIADSVALALDGDKIKEAVLAGEANEYQEQMLERLNEIKTRTDVMFLYVLTENADGEFMYYLDAIKDGDDMGEVCEFGYVDEEGVFSEDELERFEVGEHFTTPLADTGKYGWVVSGYSPIFDKDHNYVAVVGVDISVDDVLSQCIDFALKIFAAILFFGVIFSMITSRYLKKLIKTSLFRITDATKLLAQGKIEFKVRKSKDEEDDVGKLYENFSAVLKTFGSLIQGVSEMEKRHKAGEYDYRIDEKQYTGTYLDLVKGVNDITTLYVDNFFELLNVVQNYGWGKFDTSVRQYPGKLAVGNKIMDELQFNMVSVSGEMNTLAETAVGGNLSARANTDGFKGGWATILHNLNKLIEAVAVPIDEASSVLRKMAAGDLSVKMNGDYKGDFALIQTNMNHTITQLSVYITTIRDTLGAVSRNDITVQITQPFIGEFDGIKSAINEIIATLNALLKNIALAADSVNESAREISDSSRNLAEGAKTQSHTVEQLTTSVDKINEQTHKNAENSKDADELSKKSMHSASVGSERMRDMLRSMNDIKTASASITNIVKVIQDISVQTNLLALNASVEAARAGVHGRGFAVVAEEVRNLAGRSQTAANETQNLVAGIVTKINGGTELASVASSSLEEIVQGVQSVSGIISGISKASGEQAAAISQISNSVGQISKVVRTNSAASEQSASSAETLSKQSDNLNGLLSKYKI